MRKEIAELRERVPEDKAALVVFRGDLDRAIAAFVIATGAATSGLETTMFFTLWGLSVIKKKNGEVVSKRDLMQKMFAMMTPGSSESLGVSKMNYFGVGASMLRAMMKKQEVSSLEDLMELARDLGVRMIGCTMSMDVMGWTKTSFSTGSSWAESRRLWGKRLPGLTSVTVFAVRRYCLRLVSFCGEAPSISRTPRYSSRIGRLMMS
ncbi:MAG: DsrE/DsrF/DrsH-like family protein [Blastocatellales bacterium]